MGSIIADLLICGTLVRILWKSQTGFKDTDSVVMRLIRLSIEAAAVPVIAASIKVSLIYSYEDNRHLVFCVLLGRLYSNVCVHVLVTALRAWANSTDFVWIWILIGT